MIITEGERPAMEDMLLEELRQLRGDLQERITRSAQQRLARRDAIIRQNDEAHDRTDH